MEGVVKLLPVNTAGKDVGESYQLITDPPFAVALSVTVPGPHRDDGVVPVI